MWQVGHLTLAGVALLALGLAVGGDQPLVTTVIGPTDGDLAGGQVGADGGPTSAIADPGRRAGTRGPRHDTTPDISTAPRRTLPRQPARDGSPYRDAITPDPYARVPGGPAGRRYDEHHDGPTSPEGFQVAGGTSEAGGGREVTYYTVEVEPAVETDISEVVTHVEDALHDPGSWAQDHTLRRIDDPDAATIRIVLATPATVDDLCARAGLRTGGIFSCWNGRFAALNSWRWAEGASGFGDDLDGYRRYLVNHEFGHGLGYGHVGCPAVGEPAPVMMQQTKGTDGCQPNGWPYPELATDRDD